MKEAEHENKSVPWKGVDVLLFLILFWGMALWCFCSGYIAAFSSPHSHLSWNAQLTKAGINEPVFLLFAFLSIVVVAPIVEEFIFRLLFQGWLEAKFKQFRIPYASGIAIVIASFVFTVSHFSFIFAIPMHYFVMTVTHVILGISLFTFGIVYLVRKRNIKITQFPFRTKRFFRLRFFVNTGCCLLVILLSFMVYLLPFCYVGRYLLAVFLFSLIVGVVYRRSNNLLYCILLHALYNGFVIVIAFLVA